MNPPPDDSGLDDVTSLESNELELDELELELDELDELELDDTLIPDGRGHGPILPEDRLELDGIGSGDTGVLH